MAVSMCSQALLGFVGVCRLVKSASGSDFLHQVALQSKGQWARRATAFVVGLATVLIFFRQPVSSSFSRLSGDDADTLIELSILEHWRLTLMGVTSWSRTSYFFPHTDTLGYNDGFLLHGLIYAIFRFARMDPFLSGELVNIIFKLIGYTSFLLFARRVAGLPMGASIIGAALFTLANNSFLQVGHAQLLSVALVPVLGILIAEAVRNGVGGKVARATLWSSLGALLFGVWLLTSFYTIWFCCLFCLITGLAAVVVMTRQERRALVLLVSAIPPPSQRILVLNVLVWITCLLPFLRIYVPTAIEGGMHSFSDVTNYWPSLADVLHVGPGSVLFGKLDDSLATWRGADANVEHLVGFSPSLIGMTLLGTGLLFGARKTLSRTTMLLFQSMVVSVLLCLILVVHVGSHSLWTIVYHSVPGAKAIRSTGRFLLVLAAPMCLIAAWAMARLQVLGIPVTVFGAMGALLLAGELNTSAYDTLSRPLELSRMALIEPTPSECHTFYATGLAPEQATPSNGLYHPNVDAMLIAALSRIPAVNGYSTFNPADWVFDTSQPSYASHVGAFALLHHLSGLCELDVGTGRWIMSRLPSPDLPYGRVVRLDGRSGGASYLGGGWAVEDPGNGIWSMRSDANLVLKVSPQKPKHSLIFEAELSALSRDGHPDAVKISLNGNPLAVIDLNTTTQTVRVPLPKRFIAGDGLLDVVFHKSVLRSPHSLWHAADTRQLGIYLRSFRVLELDK